MKLLSLWLSSFFVLSCSQGLEVNFYHWDTNGNLNSTDKSYLESLQSKKIYIHLFDVEWDESSKKAVATNKLNSIDPSDFEYIPVVYLTNELFINSPMPKLLALADSIHHLSSLYIKQALGQNLNEIQIDVDWTPKSRLKYFKFLERLKEKDIAVSATLRLHQYKYYKKTGVPPVDYISLMFYNMGDLSNINESNSILNLAEAKKYLGSKDYPLEVNVALPCFRWAVAYRYSKAQTILNRKSLADMKHLNLKQIKANQYQVTASAYVGSTFLYKGDVVRFEGASLIELQHAIDLTRPYNSKNEWVLYHLNKESLEYYPLDSLMSLKW